MLNWGIIGLGKLAHTRIAPAFAQAPGNRLVAVAGRDATRTAEFAAQHGVRPATIEALLTDPEIGAVYVAATNDLHAPYTIAAARAGKHVLCEKPLARTPAEAEAMIAACQAAGVRLGTAFQMRFHPAHQQIRALVQEGVFGEIRQARAQHLMGLAPERQTWRLDASAGGGPLFDIGSHAVDLLTFLTGQPVRGVSALLARQTFRDRANEDAAMLNLVLGTGALAQITVAFNTPYGHTAVELHGSAGSARLDNTPGQTADGHAEFRTTGGRGLLEWEPCDLYAAEISAFAAAVAGTAPLEISGEAGLANLRVLVAAQQSARQNGLLVDV
jgi:1,5-anhydro-D-fructose reductase (1,5-anhydro-D-mannitol-forming)